MMSSPETGLPTLLYIEDDRACADLVRDALAGRFEVVIATDGFQGLDLAPTLQPAVILVDLHLPTLSGFTVIESLLQQVRPAPVVAISARVMREEARRAEALGCAAFIEKPFTLATLRETLQDVLARAEATPPTDPPRDP
jgi:CheY-like chemotaxis protein